MVLLYSFLVLLYFSLLYCIPSWFSSDLIPHIFSPVFATWISCPPYQGILSTQTGYIVLQTWKSCLSNLNIPTSQSGYPILLTWISYPPNQDILSSPPRYPVHSPGLEISPLPFFLCPYFPSFCPPNWIFRRAPVFICPPYLSSPHTLVSPARWIQFYRAKWKKRGGGYEYENSIVPILLKVRSPIQIYVGRHILWLNCVCLISYYIIGPNLKEE